MPTYTVQQAFDLALDLHRNGQSAQAEEFCRQILAAQPEQANAWHLLGVIAIRSDRNPLAVECFEKALALDAGNATACANLAAAYQRVGRTAEAIATCQRALALQPDNPEAYHNLGNALGENRQLAESVAAYSRAIQLRPEFPQAHNNLGNALKDLGRLDEAIAVFRQALRLKPDYALCQYNLGNTLRERGDLAEAVAAYRRSVELQGAFAPAWNNLGIALAKQNEFEEAFAAYGRALALQPDFAEACNNLGELCGKLGRLDEAAEAYRRALEIKPDFADALCNLGNVLKDQGLLDDAIAAYRRAVQLAPSRDILQSNVIMALQLHPDADQAAIEEEQKRWNQRFSEPLRASVQPHSNDRHTERRLRVGYLSADFRHHAVGWNIRPLFRCHNPRNFEIVCYSGVEQPDPFTDEFRQRAHGWRLTTGVSDESLAGMIRQDQVDILVDLSQHTMGNRLTMLARRPAPIQVSFAAYPASAGVDAIGYRISDRWLEAEASKIEARKSEMGRRSGAELRTPNSELRAAERVHFIDSFWCYDPCGFEASVNELPALTHGRITFGSLNNFSKVNERMLRLWARVMRAVPGSHLVLLSRPSRHRHRTTRFLAQEGIEENRIGFVDRLSRPDYLQMYHRLDVVLDPFPYGGHTTSLDALWMGVPVVSLAGKTSLSRGGLSILNNLGLPEFATFTEDEYADIAIRLAGDIPRLQELRRTLRSRMERSVLMDAPNFARQIEAAYRAMWREWCEQPGL